MRFKHSRFSKSVLVLLGLLGYTSLSNGQGCPDAQDDDLWMAEFGGALPDAAGYTWDDCASQIAGVIRNITPDGWVMHVVDDDGQGGGDDEDRSAYCKTVGVFDDDCQSAVYEFSVRTIDGDSDPPHDILDIVVFCGLRDTVKDLSIVVNMTGVGFIEGSPVGWLQIPDGE